MTQILFDPVDPKLVWMGVEIDGVHRSNDGGNTWTKTSAAGSVSEDVHGLAVLPHERRKLFAATTNKGLHYSFDNGGSWTLTPLDFGWYMLDRAVAG